MSAGGGQKLRPRSRSGATVKHSTHSRSKETHSHSTHALKSEPKNPCSVTPRHHLYFPLKDIRGYANGRPDDARVNTATATSRKGWEARVYEKSRSQGQGQGQRRQRSHSTSIYMEPWSKYETLQNYRNRVGAGTPISVIRWNPSILDGEIQKFSGKSLNNNMSYNGEFRREPNILENPEHHLLPFVDQLIETRDLPDSQIAPEIPEKSEEMKTELYTELLKYLTDEWDSKNEEDDLGAVMRVDRGLNINMASVPQSLTSPVPSMKPRNPSKSKSVTFTPDTIFFERNLNSRFWLEITYRQQVRRIQRRRLGKIDLRLRSVKSSTDVRNDNTTGSTYSLSTNSSVNEPTIRRKHRHRLNNKNRGFWDGLRKAIASIFTCSSTDRPPRRRIP